MLDAEILAFIEEVNRQIAAVVGKPSYSFGYAALAPALTWLEHTASVVSNKTGIPFGLSNGRLIELWVGNEVLTQYDISIYYHNGNSAGLTLLKTVTVPNTGLTKVFNLTDLGTIVVPKNVQIAVQISSVTGPNPKNLAVHATITGVSP